MAQLLFDDINLGDKYVGTSITITDAHVVIFAGLTGDFYGLHMNEEFAKNTPFKGRIAHGALTFVVGLGMIASQMAQMKVVAALGFEKVKFAAPVKIGDTITSEAEVIEKKSKSDKAGAVWVSLKIKTQDGTVAIDTKMGVLVSKA